MLFIILSIAFGVLWLLTMGIVFKQGRIIKAMQSPDAEMVAKAMGEIFKGFKGIADL